jgi:hypothetical protein
MGIRGLGLGGFLRQQIHAPCGASSNKIDCEVYLYIYIYIYIYI